MPIDIRMPKLSPTMTEGRLANWTVAEGDVVSSGDVIAEVETDKATMEVEALEDGIIHKILIQGGADVKVGAAIGIMAEEGEEVPADYTPEEAKEEAPAEEEKTEETKAAPAAAPAPAAMPTQAKIEMPKQVKAVGAAVSNKLPSQGGKKASPLARKMADELGIDLDYVTGSGPYGRITRKDVEAAAVLGGGSGSSVFKRDVNPMEQIALTPMRRAIAARLTESKQMTPHFYLSMDVKMDDLLKMRKQLNANADGKFKLTVNDFIVRASALALNDFPAANASWNVDEIIQYGAVDISIAVAIEGGLITPILADAENKNIFDSSSEIKGLIKQAREGTLKPEQFQGGGFSISNLGMFGVKNFQAIVNPPQAAILAVGGTEEKVTVENGEIGVSSVMNLTLSVDHRVIDGALGAEVLGKIKYYLENPTLLVV